MPTRAIIVPETVPDELAAGFGRLVDELGISEDFSDEVADAAIASAEDPELPGTDRTDVDFFAIDPPDAKDIDQIMQLARDGDGFIVRYAIADVGLFVEPSGPVDREAHRRGQTLYAPHRRFALHPAVLSEGAASLLANQSRPAMVWQIKLSGAGEVVDVDLGRAMVRSRAQLTYAQAQQRIDDGTAEEPLLLLREIGTLRQEIEKARGGVSLTLPDQEVEVVDDQWRLAYRAPFPVEDWNAQISLLTGICAANLMLDAKVGIVRTLPPVNDYALTRLHRTASALGIDWPDDLAYPDFVRGIDPSTGQGVAMMYACTSLFRGAGYVSFDGVAPEQATHAALATPYAHTTAPLRRLVDRYSLECCAAITAGAEVPQWVRAALPQLAEEMAGSDQRAKRFESGILDLVEATVLQPSVGRKFRGTVVEVDKDKPDQGRLLLADPAVEAPVSGATLQAGAAIEATLESVDVEAGTVRFVAV